MIQRRPKNLLQEDDENFIVEGRPDLAGTIGFVTGYNEHTLVFLLQVVGTKEELEVHADQIVKHPLSDGETVFVPFNVPSSKNSKIATDKGVFHSKTVSRYLQNIGISYFSSSKRIFEKYKQKPCYFPVNLLQESFKDVKYPIEIGFHFVRDSFRDFDFQNAVQLPLDIMTSAKIIPDDNMSFIAPKCLKQNNKFYTIAKKASRSVDKTNKRKQQ